MKIQIKREYEEQVEWLRDLPCGIAIFRIEQGKIYTEYMNESVAEISGKTVEEIMDIIGRDPLKVVDKRDYDRVKKEIETVVKENTRLDTEFRLKMEGVPEYWIRVSAKKVEREPQKILFYTVLLDVTNSKKEEHLMKRQFEAENCKLQEMQCKTIASLRINYTKDTIEYFHCTDHLLDCVLEKKMSYSQYISYVAGLIQNPNETQRYCTLLDRQHVLDCFANGNNEIDFDYRRYDEKHAILWMNSHVKLMNRPNSSDVIGFAYAKDVDVEMQDYTLNRILLDRLRTMLFQKLFFVMAAHMDTRRYDIIQFSDSARWQLPLEGDLDVLLHQLHQIVDDEQAEEFFAVLSDREQLKQKLKEQKNDEWTFVCKASERLGIKWMEIRVVCIENENLAEDVYLLTVSNMDEVKEQENRLQQALRKAERAGRAKQEFLSHMSHEMRTPLNGIKGALDILKESEDSLTQNNRELLHAAILSTNHLTSIINDVLDMSKISEGKMQLYKSWIAMDELMEQLSVIIAPMATEKKIKYVQDVDLQSFQLIYSDMGRLKQIFLNMLSNAVKFTPMGGMIKLTARTKILGHQKIHVDFEIIDNGIGMAEKFVKRAFEPFEQEARDMSQVGTGLGMTITKQLVGLLGGTFHLQSTIGIGTKVKIGFDFRASKYDARNLKKNESKNVYSGCDFSGFRCLIVEDNEINLLIAKRQLESMHLETEVACNGEEAVEMFEQSKEWYYDIIFMDIMMPVKDGLTATMEIRSMQRPDAAQIPIVAMTANAFVEDVNKTLSSGMNYHLAKPFDKEQIQEVLVQEFASEEET